MKLDATFAVATAPKRNSRHWEQGTVTWGELLAWIEMPGDKKESGNYLLGELRETTVQHKDSKGQPDGGPCTDLHRRKQAVVMRSAITLDVDHPSKGFADQVELLYPHAGIMHTTYNSSPDEPRYRLILPTDRELAPDEYVMAAQVLMAQLGAEQFDSGSSEPERYMFRPAAQEPSWFQAWVLDGAPVSVDDLLADFEEDLSAKPLPRPHRNKRDPFTIDGIVGAFNRAYVDWDLLIEAYELPYSKVTDDRYQLAGARSQAGMGPVAGTDGLVFSHHANDPAFGKTCSAFDLVRLHRFGDLDEAVKAQTPVNKLPSNDAMLELATQDPRALAEMVGLDFDDLGSDDEEDTDLTSQTWKLDLRRNNRGRLLDVIANWDLITANDPVFAQFYYNELSLSVEVSGERLPWRELGPRNRVLTDTDRWEVVYYVEREYGIRPARGLMDSLINTSAMQLMVNPVRDYLQLLKWDGVERVETCLPGVVPTPFTRMVARKSMVAAVARMFDPGCKWDHTLVLEGDEGLGKSWWVGRMSRGFSSPLGRLGDKDTLLVMQRSWIMVADEGHSLRNGERLFLDELESVEAAQERERYVEEDALAGVIEEYLETKVPVDWWEMSPEQRRQWLLDRAEGFHAEGTERIDQTCSSQVWVEALGRRVGDSRRTDLLEITNAIKRIPGWKAVEGRHRLPGYGPQLVFKRDVALQRDLEDLL